ncbi:MAG: hypothetical protein Q9M28_10685 [Mariprofundaceae bacterium]|nr:hypothetical protein [Mariprofundaceae bacterium]
MGQGAHVVICNGTSDDWELYNTHSYQMNAWDFPKKISSGETVKIYVEWNQGVWTTESDDQGKAYYKVNGKRLLIHANGKNGFNIKIKYLDYFSDYCNPDQDFDLGWHHDGDMLFILSGNDNCRYWENSGTAKNVMLDSRSVIGNKTLKDICIVGSHDSGMSKSKLRTAGALDCNTITQTKNIENQLNYGVRFFDIRPVISGGNFYTGHYSKIKKMGFTTWQGGRGQSIENIIDNLNSFTKDREEAVILNLSHAYNTDTGNSSYKDFTNEEWTNLLSMIKKGVHSLYQAKEHNPLDVTLNDLLFTPAKSSVIVIIPSHVAEHNKKLSPAFVSIDIYDEYSETNDYDRMKKDQLQKMKDHSRNTYFLLSWTLTQDTTQALLCEVGGSSIIQLADKANDGLVYAVMNGVDPKIFPNIISLDNITNCNPALLAYGINMNT